MSKTSLLSFRTQRVMLREFNANDVDELAGLYSVPSVMRYVADGSVGDASRAAVSIERFRQWYKECGYGPLHAELTSGQFIGRVGLVPWDLPWGKEVELNILLTPARWRQGYATEVANELLYRASLVGIPRIVGVIHPENTASICFARSMGFVSWRTAQLHGYEASVFMVNPARRRI